MKKTLLALLIILLPALVFAEFQIGPAIQYKIPLSAASKIPGKHTVSINDFSFGADARLNIKWFQICGYGLLEPGDSTFSLPTSLKIYVDGGILLKLAFLRLAAGIGPDFIVNFDSTTTPSQLNGNVRFAGDIVLGRTSVSLVYLIECNLTKVGVLQAFENVHGQLGLSVLFKIF